MPSLTPPVLKSRDIRRLRLMNQWLSPRSGTTPAEVAVHMGALQAQEIWSGEWSIAARCVAATRADVHAATTDARIVRTWPMRGTIHFVPAQDAHWMLDLAESTAFKGVDRRREFLGLDVADADAAIVSLRDALSHGNPVTRSECLDILEKEGLMKDRAHAYHLLWYASQHGAICIGPNIGAEQTFVNLDRWVGDRVQRTRDDALAEIAFRYFDSHGPAEAKELSRWTGFSAADIKHAISLAGDRLSMIETEFGQMLASTRLVNQLDGSGVDQPEKARSVLLLSGFDEYMLGYGDRSAMITKEQLKLVVPGNNGMFKPTVVDDGAVIGTWKRTTKKSLVDIEVSPFNGLNKRQLKGIERAAGEYGEFIGVESRVVVVT